MTAEQRAFVRRTLAVAGSIYDATICDYSRLELKYSQSVSVAADADAAVEAWFDMKRADAECRAARECRDAIKKALK